VEREEKSISIDGLYKISVALAVPLRVLTDVSRRGAPTPTAERIFALVSAKHPGRRSDERTRCRA
jgi:hypothetical protein